VILVEKQNSQQNFDFYKEQMYSMMHNFVKISEFWCKNKIVSRVRELGVVYEINAIVEFLNSACDEFCLASQKSSGNY
jgi:hypothetical protein